MTVEEDEERFLFMLGEQGDQRFVGAVGEIGNGFCHNGSFVDDG